MKLILALLLIVFSAACVPSAEAQSGWKNKVDGSPQYDQCNILIDSVGTWNACFHRVSIMCMQDGEGYSRGLGQWGAPIEFPVTADLYQPPSIAPAGSITIVSLSNEPGVPSVIGLNDSPSADWYSVAPYTGQSCTGLTRVKPNDR